MGLAVGALGAPDECAGVRYLYEIWTTSPAAIRLRAVLCCLLRFAARRGASGDCHAEPRDSRLQRWCRVRGKRCRNERRDGDSSYGDHCRAADNTGKTALRRPVAGHRGRLRRCVLRARGVRRRWGSGHLRGWRQRVRRERWRVSSSVPAVRGLAGAEPAFGVPRAGAGGDRRGGQCDRYDDCAARAGIGGKGHARRCFLQPEWRAQILAQH